MAVGTGLSKVEWLGPDGSVWDLHDGRSTFLLHGVAGFGAAPRSVVSDVLPSGGALVRSTTVGPRTVTLPLHLRTDSMDQFLATFPLLLRSFTATARSGPGQLRVTRPDGSVRTLVCFYSAGLDADDGRGLPRTTVALQLFAPDPFWTETVTRHVSFPYVPARPYLAPFLTVAPSQALGSAAVMVDGSVETFPTWRLTGPFTQATLSNGSDSFTANATCAAGEVWTIDTRPSVASATSSTGANLIPYLNWPYSTLWPLRPGENDLTIALTGAATGTVADLFYSSRSETP